MNSPRATAWSSMRRQTWFFATRAKSRAVMSSPSCGDDKGTRLIRKLRAQALPFRELRAHICAKPTEGDDRGQLRNVNAERGYPMKMPQSGYARDPRKCVRFRVKVTRQTQFWGAIGRKTGAHFC